MSERPPEPPWPFAVDVVVALLCTAGAVFLAYGVLTGESNSYFPLLGLLWAAVSFWLKVYRYVRADRGPLARDQ